VITRTTFALVAFVAAGCVLAPASPPETVNPTTTTSVSVPPTFSIEPPVANSPGGETASVALDRASLSEDGRSVELVVVGAPPMSEGRPCGEDYDVTSAIIRGSVLDVAVTKVASRQGDCLLTELVCCDHALTVELPAGAIVDTVRDQGHPFNPLFFLARPAGLLELHGLPDGWAMRREWADWGGTWTRIYAKFSDPPPGSPDTLEFGTTFGGAVVIEPEALQPPVLVNGKPATYQRYPSLGEIDLQWIAGDQKLWLDATETHFTIGELVALAAAAAAP
jgi:hypothetical protein